MPGPHSGYEAALEQMRECQKIVDSLQELSIKVNGRGTSEYMELLHLLDTFVPSGMYRHFKSTNANRKLYAVIGISESTEQAGDYVVVYASCYGPFDGKIGHRPLLGTSGFMVPVKNRGEYSGPRFVLEKAMSKEQVAASFR